MPKKNDNNSSIVYSTEYGKICPSCGNSNDKCNCRQKKKITAPSNAPKDGIIRVSRETKGRKGKGVTIITGINLNKDKLKQLAKVLKQKCGSGGCVKGETIEIQGEHRDTIIAELKNQGYNAKRSGG